MEKIMFSLWRPEQQSASTWRQALMALQGPLQACGASQIRVMVVDEAMDKAASQRITFSQSPLDGMLSLWVDSASMLAPIQALIQDHVARLHAYLVCESEPYPQERKARIARFQADVPLGERSPGMCQLALFRKPVGMDFEQWMINWREGHGSHAYPLQSIFGYRQNLVVRTLTPESPELHAIVEEQFPDIAIGSAHGFYDTQGDEQLLAERQKYMADSAGTLMDFSSLDCVLTSFYQVSA